MNRFLESFARFIINQRRESFDSPAEKAARIQQIVGKLNADHLADRKWLQHEVQLLVNEMRGELTNAKTIAEHQFAEGALLTACYIADLLEGRTSVIERDGVQYDV